MQEQQSGAVFQLLEITDVVTSSVDAHGVGVAGKLKDRFFVTLEELEDVPTEPGFEASIFTLQGALRRSAEAMAEVDRGHVRNLAVIQRLLQRREELRQALYRKLMVARHTVSELYGEDAAFTVAGLEGPTAEESTKLLHQARLAVTQLRAPGLELPDAAVGGIRVEPEDLAADLETHSEGLRSVTSGLLLTRRAADQTRKDKNRAVAEHQQQLLQTSRILEGYYVLAGETELAERIRPATRRSGRPLSSEEPTSGEPGTDEPATEEPASEEPAPQGTAAEGSPPEDSPPEGSPSEESDPPASTDA